MKAINKVEFGEKNNILAQSDAKVVYKVTKRIIDILFSSITLIILAPAMVLVAILIKLDSKGPLFTGQNRVGQWGRPFKLYKFRTVKLEQKIRDDEESELPVYKVGKDPRITKVGRFLRLSSIDELPQLINILKGEMSIVGPRPVFPFELEISEKRKIVCMLAKPGVTGISQISRKPNKNIAELDLEYINSASIITDIKIFVKTIAVVLNKNAGY